MGCLRSVLSSKFSQIKLSGLVDFFAPNFAHMSDPNKSHYQNREISNPFKGKSIDNFPPLSPYLEQDHHDKDHRDLYDDQSFDYSEHYSTLEDEENSLDLSIDTLARAKPVDMSNMSQFLAMKEQEEKEEVCYIL